MQRLIDAHEMYKYLNSIGGCDAEPESWSDGWDKAIDAAICGLDDIPTIDAVPVVWCKDCEHSDTECHKDNLRYCMRGIKGDDYNETGYIYPLEVIVRDDDFCSYGKRRVTE